MSTSMPQPDAGGHPTRRRLVFGLVTLLALVVIVGGLVALWTRLPHTSTPTPTQGTQTNGIACVQRSGTSGTTFANVLATHDNYHAHSETMVVEDPNDPLHLVGGAKYFPDISRYVFQVGYVASFDGGCTWLDGGALPGFSTAYLTSDPSFAFGPEGHVYASVLYDSRDDSGIAVYTSTDGGRTFGAPVRVFDDATGHVFSDKPWIMVDQTNSPHRGSVYVAWSYDHLGGCNEDGTCAQQLGFSRSTDGGKTFSPVQLIEGQAPFCTDSYPTRPADSRDCDLALGAIPAMLPDGSIAVAFDYLAVDGHTPTRLLVVTSHDGGATWSAPVIAATISDVNGVFPPQRYRVTSLPALAADPRSDTLYMTWADKATGDADILLATSTDAGVTWSTPVRVNDDAPRNGAQQSQPQIAVAPNGVVSISFFDSRNAIASGHLDVYLAQSVDGGKTFLPNVRVTEQSFDPAIGAARDESGLQFIGDYQGLTADNQYAHPFWNDSRTGTQEIVTAVVPSAQP